MQLYSESVEVANVQWAKVAVESVVQECLVDAEVDGGMRLGPCGRRTYVGTRRPLRRRLALLGVGKWRVGVGRTRVRCQVEAVLDVLGDVDQNAFGHDFVLVSVVMLTSIT
jgi:hypothetical protein